MFLARINIDPENVRYQLEDAPTQITRNLVDGLAIEYFNIDEVTNPPTLELVTLKPGTRTAGTLTEIAEVEAGGVVVGSAEVVKV